MKLGAYKNLKVKAPDRSYSEAELARSVKNMQMKNSVFFHIDDRAAQVGDVVVLNYEGFVDGKPFVGGKATHHRLTLGEGKYIPGFEDQIVGHCVNEDFDIKVRFPENYGNPQLAGRDGLFKTTLLFMGKEEIPDFDNDFALDFSTFSTAEELLGSLKQTLISKKEYAEEERVQEELLTQIIEASEIPVNQDILDELAEEILEDRLYDLELQGISLENYLKGSHKTMEDLQYECRKKARRNYQQTAVLHAVAAEEGLEVSEEELVEAVYESVGYDEMDAMEVLENMDEDELTGLELQILCDKAMALIRQEAEYI